MLIQKISLYNILFEIVVYHINIYDKNKLMDNVGKINTTDRNNLPGGGTGDTEYGE